MSEGAAIIAERAEHRAQVSALRAMNARQAERIRALEDALLAAHGHLRAAHGHLVDLNASGDVLDEVEEAAHKAQEASR